MAARPLEIIPITVEMRDKIEKPRPPLENIRTNQSTRTDARQKESPKIPKVSEKPATPPPVSPASPKTDDILDFRAPEIDKNLLSAVESEIVTNMNRLLDNNTINKVKDNSSYIGRFINEQLAGLDSNSTGANNTAQEVGREINAARGNVDSNFINFDLYPANNRAITYAPPKPNFALPNDTSIKVKFKVDGNGNVYDIILVTRNIPQVERIASDYIKNLKFAANGNNDQAAITLTFKVRGK